MDIVFAKLEVSGDFKLVDIIERGEDRDFILEPPSQIINLRTGGENIASFQFTRVRRILIRASANPQVPQATIHLLSDTDLYSAFVNFEMDAGRYTLTITDSGHGVEFAFEGK